MEELQELLSLATFEPDKAYEPYLNTPRSLEACRLNGVNPIELVEIPIGEFQKDFPNDPDAVQRRYERVDGARRRMLQYVINDWKDLCASGWAPPRDRPKSAKETIVQVSAGAHCTLLELQAQRFRKIERDNWDALNRQLKMELRQADMEQKNKRIVQKHKEIENQNNNVKKERMLMLEQLHREEMEKQKRKEEEEAEEVRRLQEMDRELARKKQENDEINRRKEKQNRERREADRVQREQYTKQLKTSIMTGLENKTEQKKRVLDIRDKNMEDRVEQTRREREKMLEQRRAEKEERLRKAREDQIRQDEEDRAEMLARISQNQEKRNRLQEQRDRERQEMNNKNEDATKEKLAKIKASNDDVINGKASKTLEAMQLKEELARQELKRVQEAQDKRKCIKSIRQEAFNMAAHRARKAQEYKMMRLNAEIKNKDDRCAAIKKGFFALDHMRNSMKDIMEKTNNELKHEMHQLRHKDAFDPDEVMRKALQVGNTVLFPRLERTFGISDSPFGKSGPLQGGGANIFPSEFGNSNAGSGRAKTSSSTGDLFASNDFLNQNGDGAPLGAGTTTTGGLGGTHRAGGDTKKAHGKSTTTSRMGFEPLHIQSMTQDRLQQALSASKQRVLGRTTSSAKGESRQKKGAANNFFEDDDDAFGDYGADGSNDDEGNGPKAILKLPEERPQPLSPIIKPPRSRGMPGGLNSSTSSQASASVTQLLPLSPDSRRHATFADDGGDPPTPSTKEKRGASREGGSSPSGKDQKAKASMGGSKRANRVRPSSAEDVKLPMFKFDPLRPSEVSRGEALPPEEGLEAFSRPESPVLDGHKDNAQAAGSPTNAMPLSLSRKLNAMADIRTDVNDRAKFLEPPTGKFRREFSNDHPLAKNGTGKYTSELKKGVTPAGMHVEVPERLKNTNVSDTISVASKIERLTYTAQRRVVDPKQQIEELKKQQNATLKRIVMEERDAEAAREQTLRSVADPQERHNLESVFSEERRRASDRIIVATRSHEEAMRQMVLSMMDLGVGGVGYGKDETRLPMSNFFQ